MIYLDTSVALAHLLAEDHQPPATLWEQPLTSSRLLEYELWTRLHARKLPAAYHDSARELLERVSFLELGPLVLARALEPFPTPVRTLDALHLSSIEFLRGRRVDLRLATFDDQMKRAAVRLGIELFAGV